MRSAKTSHGRSQLTRQALCRLWRGAGLRTLIAIVSLIGELAVTAYLALEAWLLTGWMVSDSLAVGWSSRDWYRTGLTRFLIAFVIALVFGLVVYLLNGYAMRDANRRWRPLRVVLASSFAVTVTLAALIGTIDFVTSKPFM